MVNQLRITLTIIIKYLSKFDKQTKRIYNKDVVYAKQM